MASDFYLQHVGGINVAYVGFGHKIIIQKR